MSKISKSLKSEVTEKANQFVEEFLKPNFIKSPPKDKEMNYIVDIYIKWWGNKLYFCSKYHSPHPNAISPYFEDKFARLTYIGEQNFEVSYIRHTDEWWNLGVGPIETCIEEMEKEPELHPGIL